jgi:streptogramin lyase
MNGRMSSMVAGGVVLILAASLPAASFGQTSALGGTIAGRVTADKGAVHAVRIKAEDTVHMITYTVFTLKAHYQIYNLPPGSYRVYAQVTPQEEGFESSTQNVELKAGETKQADVVLTAKEAKSNFELVDWDTLFPKNPARDVLLKECAGCHEPEHIPWQKMGGRSEEGWRLGVNCMFQLGCTQGTTTQVNPAGVPVDQRVLLAKYLASTFPEGGPERDLKLDDLPLDEGALSRAIYVSYLLPPPPAGFPADLVFSHDVYPSKASSTIWIAEMGVNRILGMDPHDLSYPDRFRQWVVPNPNNYKAWNGIPNVMPHGITEDRGHVYSALLNGSAIGDLDPATGEINEYKTPTKSTPHTLTADSKGNVWFTEMQGASKIGRVDANTKSVKEYDPSPEYKNAHYYGIIVDKKDRVWSVGLTAHIIVGYDPRTDKWTTYPTPTQPSGPRRLTVDSKGMVWFSEHLGQRLGMLNPDTGRITEYKDPYKWGGDYECYADAEDNIWVTLRSYGTLVKFEPQTKKYTYYPMPMADLRGRPYPPKIGIDQQGTIWFAGLRMDTLNSFRPNGNVPTTLSARK